MTLDKAIWQEALAYYRAWNEAEFLDRVRNAGKKTDAEKWREYKDLFAFGQRFRPTPSARALAKSAQEWAAYYEKIQLFEAQRKRHG